MKQELVGDWMTQDVITITPETSLTEAHELMRSRWIRRLPVVDHGRLAGIVTLRDERGANPSTASSLSVWEANDLLANLKVSKIMARKVETIGQQASIAEAAKIMLEKKISGLPVLDEAGHLVGIITESDIFRLVASEWSKSEGIIQIFRTANRHSFQQSPFDLPPNSEDSRVQQFVIAGS